MPCRRLPTQHHDVFNRPQLLKHVFELPSDLREFFLVAFEKRDRLMSRLPLAN